MNELNLNKIYVGAVDIVMSTINDVENIKNNRTIKTALLYKINDVYYTDLETGILISKTLENLNKGDYFVNSSKYFIKFSNFLQTFGIKIDNNKITNKEALQLFKENMEIIYKAVESKKVESTLTIIKPDAMDKIDEIIEMFYKNGLKITDYKIQKLDEDIVKDHYSHLLDKPFFPKLRDFMMSSEVAIMILEGQNAVEKLRKLMGPTDSTKAEKETIRGKFGTDVTYNAIHGSDSVENAEIEIKRFFKQKQKRI